MSLQMLPTSLLYEILKNVPFPSRWESSLVCKTWYEICHDPYLYLDIHLEYMELHMLVKTLQWIQRLGSVKVRSLALRHCYCQVLRDTLIPVTFRSPQPNQPTFYTQLRTLTLDRRRMEYKNHQFTLYDDLSDVLTRLLLQFHQKGLSSLEISHCDIDWAMTDLFTIMLTAGRHLTKWIYHDNYSNHHYHDNSNNNNNNNNGCQYTNGKKNRLAADDLLQAMILAFPNMKHFMGQHDITNDTVMMMARHWTQLESLVLSSPNTTTKTAATTKATTTMMTKRDDPVVKISAKAFYTLISHCSSLHTLELCDVQCINEWDLRRMCHWRDVQQKRRQRSYHPYQSTLLRNRLSSDKRIGISLRHVKLTQYVTTPLLSQGILQLLALFPHLQTLIYATNHHCYQIAMHDDYERGQLQEMMKEWRQLQQNEFISSAGCKIITHFDTPVTMEQRLLLTSYSLG
ncbi:uncharacterized protein BX664DRAFT_385169 [Halteromyces radiatus]|uniref:uncharacterized protein n=1 Tax=Halteromyces radiatus TaxID=101107 RepID=UPI00221EE13A|nr:uncharacterized protein BX664DRAFT_385169 [Halteromyces radiatus]KAI8093808.1 hypothetical protein BX664DRAFT_385169 [Halteromyces radiatus]